MKTVPLERQIHLGIVQLLKLSAAPGVVWFHCANERRTSPREGAFLKRMGVLAGVADFTLIIPQWRGDYMMMPRIAFLEVKRPGGRLTDAQKGFRLDVTQAGCSFDTAFSTDQAAEILKSWGALRSHPLTSRLGREAAAA